MTVDDLAPLDRLSRQSLGEHNDCTVHAVSNALRIPYVEAHRRLAELGRKKGRGFPFRGENIEKLGFEPVPEFACKRWHTLEATLPKTGAFIMRVRAHAFAVVGGKVYDGAMPLPGKVAKMVYQVKPTI